MKFILLLKRSEFWMMIGCFAMMMALGCGNDESVEDEEQTTTATENDEDAFAAPDPSEGMQLIGKSFDIQPGQDISMCIFVNLDLKEDLEIAGFVPLQGHGGHHVTLFIADRYYETGAVIECAFDSSSIVGENGIAMPNWKIVAGSVPDKKDIFPPGYAFKIPAGETLVMNAHYINTTDQVIKAKDAVNIYYAKKGSEPTVYMDSMVGLNTHFRVEPGEKGSSTAECMMNQDINITSLTGHIHAAGKLVTIWVVDGEEANQVFQTQAVGIDPNQLKIYPVDQPLAIKTGQKIRWQCDWDNTEGTTALTWPGEMCVVFFHYFPGTDYYICEPEAGETGTFVPFDEL